MSTVVPKKNTPALATSRDRQRESPTSGERADEVPQRFLCALSGAVMDARSGRRNSLEIPSKRRFDTPKGPDSDRTGEVSLSLQRDSCVVRGVPHTNRTAT